MKMIADTVFYQDNMVDEYGYINLQAWSGRPLNRIPLSVRDPNEAILHVNSLSYLINDPTCDPRSGGIAGYEDIAKCYGVGAQQFRRYILPKCDYIKRLGGIPVTHVSSAAYDAGIYKQEIKACRLKNLGIES